MLARRLTAKQLLLVDGLNRDHLYLAQGERVRLGSWVALICLSLVLSAG